MKKQYFASVSLILLIGLFTLTTAVYDANMNKTIIADGNLEHDLRTSAWNTGFNYTMIDNAPYSWIEISQTGTNITSSFSGLDDGSTGISFPTWNFTFYGTEYDTINISTQGYLSFSGQGDLQSSGYDTIPQDGSIGAYDYFNDTVFLFYTDINLDPSPPGNGGGSVFYKFGGTAPNRYLVIEYYQVCNYSDDAFSPHIIGDFEVIFYENGDINFQYKLVNNIYWDNSQEPKVGLDHGDLVNYNVYTNNWTDTFGSVDVTERAVYFQLDELPDGGNGDPPGLDPLIIILAITIPSVVGVVVIGLGLYFKKNPEKLKSFSNLHFYIQIFY